MSSSDGKQQKARTVLVATGFGAERSTRTIPGMETFEGECHDTARWPQGGLDMTGWSSSAPAPAACG